MDSRERSHCPIFDPESDLLNKLRSMTMKMMKSQIPNKPDIWETLTPNFPPGCKWVIITDIWRSGAHALYGVMVESIPNFAMLDGTQHQRGPQPHHPHDRNTITLSTP
jgi:hypothetical protein